MNRRFGSLPTKMTVRAECRVCYGGGALRVLLPIYTPAVPGRTLHLALPDRSQHTFLPGGANSVLASMFPGGS